MKPFAPKIRVSANLRNQRVIAVAQANRDGERIEVIVELWDAQGRPLDWTLTRMELAVIARAAQRAHEAAEKSPP